MNRFPRPSAATAISLAALFFAVSGTAVAATGGDFILGKANTATKVSSLTNTKGTALSLSSAAKTPPLEVSNSVLVPNLDASELDGRRAGTFIRGSGSVASGEDTEVGHGLSNNFISVGDSYISGSCDVGGTGASLTITHDNTANAQVVWWNQSGASDADFSRSSQVATISPISPVPYLVVAQIATPADIVTYTLTARYNSGADTCSFTGQAVMTSLHS